MARSRQTGDLISNLDSITAGNVVTVDANGNPVDGNILVTQISNPNAVINGNFDIWQRGISQTTFGYGSDDRWSNNNIRSTKTHSQQTFVLGQTDVPNNPKYFSRTVVNSANTADSEVVKYQPIENVNTFAGQTVTLSFYAKADASKNMGIEFFQYFGTGGSPSDSVTAIDVQTVTLTTSWQKYAVTASIPSVSGKTIGTNNNDWFTFLFWFDAGSNLDTRSGGIGNQSGTFDIAQVKLEEGSQATAFQPRSIGEELALCQRYYETGEYNIVGHPLAPGNTVTTICSFNASKRVNPTITFIDKGRNNCGATSVFVVTEQGFQPTASAITQGQANYRDTWTADAEL